MKLFLLPLLTLLPIPCLTDDIRSLLDAQDHSEKDVHSRFMSWASAAQTSIADRLASHGERINEVNAVVESYGGARGISSAKKDIVRVAYERSLVWRSRQVKVVVETQIRAESQLLQAIRDTSAWEQKEYANHHAARNQLSASLIQQEQPPAAPDDMQEDKDVLEEALAVNTPIPVTQLVQTNRAAAKKSTASRQAALALSSDAEDILGSSLVEDISSADTTSSLLAPDASLANPAESDQLSSPPASASTTGSLRGGRSLSSLAPPARESSDDSVDGLMGMFSSQASDSVASSLPEQPEQPEPLPSTADLPSSAEAPDLPAEEISAGQSTKIVSDDNFGAFVEGVSSLSVVAPPNSDAPSDSDAVADDDDDYQGLPAVPSYLQTKSTTKGQRHKAQSSTLARRAIAAMHADLGEDGAAGQLMQRLQKLDSARVEAMLKKLERKLAGQQLDWACDSGSEAKGLADRLRLADAHKDLLEGETVTVMSLLVEFQEFTAHAQQSRSEFVSLLSQSLGNSYDKAAVGLGQQLRLRQQQQISQLYASMRAAGNSVRQKAADWDTSDSSWNDLVQRLKDTIASKKGQLAKSRSLATKTRRICFAALNEASTESGCETAVGLSRLLFSTRHALEILRE